MGGRRPTCLQSWAGSSGWAVLAALTSVGLLGVFCGFHVVNPYSKSPACGLLVSNWIFWLIWGFSASRALTFLLNTGWIPTKVLVEH